MQSSNRSVLLNILENITDCPEANNVIPLLLKNKIEHDIKYIYFTYISNNLLISLFSISTDVFGLVIIKNKEQKVYLNDNLLNLLYNICKTDRKCILNIDLKKIKVLSDEVLNKQYQFDYINVDISTLNLKTEIFDISGLLNVTNDTISRLGINYEIKTVILNNNVGITDIDSLLSRFPGISELYISNMKHIKDKNITVQIMAKKIFISNCGITLRTLLNLENAENICILNMNLECQVNMFSQVITYEEWYKFKSVNVCEELCINSNNLTMDCMKYICESMPYLQRFYVLDIILEKLKSGAVRAGYEKEIIEFISYNNKDNKLVLNRDIKWKILLSNNCGINP